MSQPLRLTTRLDLVCRGLDFEADVTLDYHRGEPPVIAARREDCEPGRAPWCRIQSVAVATDDPDLPAFTAGELHQAAETAAEQRLDAIAQQAEQEGYVPVAKGKNEASLVIEPMPAPRVADLPSPGQPRRSKVEVPAEAAL